MFEIGNKVRFRSWSNQPWHEGVWIIVEITDTFQIYDDVYHTYLICNEETSQYQYEVNWQQIELI